MAYRNSNRRKFVWARTAGTIGLAPPAVGSGGGDLLESVRGRYGGENFVGATVMTVKGFLKPARNLDTSMRGRAGIRIVNEGETGEGTAIPNPGAGPGDGLSAEGRPELDWMGFFPFILAADRPADVATWNLHASPYTIDIQAPRRMEELGQSLGLFVDVTDQPPEGSGARLDYDLSVGLKLA